MPVKPDKPRQVMFAKAVNTPNHLIEPGKTLSDEETQKVAKIPQRLFPAGTPIQLTAQQIETHGLREGVDFEFVNNRGINKKPKR